MSVSGLLLDCRWTVDGLSLGCLWTVSRLSVTRHNRGYPGIPGGTWAYPGVPGNTQGYMGIPGGTQVCPVSLQLKCH